MSDQVNRSLDRPQLVNEPARIAVLVRLESWWALVAEARKGDTGDIRALQPLQEGAPDDCRVGHPVDEDCGHGASRQSGRFPIPGCAPACGAAMRIGCLDDDRLAPPRQEA